MLGHTEGLLYRRGNFNGGFDDLILRALMSERDAEVALSPGFRWGATLLPGQEITVEDVYHHTAITYPNAYRTEMSGRFLREVLEDVADNLFNPDPYYRQGGDMVRVGGIAYSIDVGKPIGRRISEMTLIRTGRPIDPDRNYVVSGWASVNEDTQGPPVYDVVSARIRACASADASSASTDLPVLTDLFDDSVSNDRLIEALHSLRVPRNLFKFMYRLMVDHCNAHTDDQPVWQISSDRFEATLAVYNREQDAVDRGVRAG